MSNGSLASHTTPRIVTVGISNLDHSWQIDVFPPLSSRTRATSYLSQGGGPAATAAAAMAQLGAVVDFYTYHGDDVNGQTCTAELESFGVHTRNIQILKGQPTIVSGILVTPAGERYIFPYKPGYANVDPTSPDLKAIDLDAVTEASCVLTDGHYPVLNEAVLKAARAHSVPVVADFGSTTNWHLARYADYLIVSEECATAVLGRNDPEAALSQLKQFEAQLVGVTLGEQGFLYEQYGDVRHVPALPVEVVDTTGAGDVFHGAYAYAVARGFGAEYCGLFASVTAALSCTALGGRGRLPAASEVENLLLTQTAREMDEQRWI